MTYTAWCDGSLTKNGKAYIAYVIKDHSNKEERFLSVVNDVYTSYAAEVSSLFYLCKRILELELKKVSIFTDCLSLQLSLNSLEKKNSILRNFEKSFGVKEMIFLNKRIQWKSRKGNLAHPLFAMITENVPSIDFYKDFGKKINLIPSPFKGIEILDTPLHKVNKKIKKQRTHSEKEEQDFLENSNTLLEKYFTIEFNDESVRVPERVLKTFKKSLNVSNDLEVLAELKEKMMSSTIIETNNSVLFKKGRLSIQLRNSVIEDLTINVHEKPNPNSLKDNLQELKVPSSYQLSGKPISSHPELPFQIADKVFNKYIKGKEREKALSKLAKNISSASIYTIGKVKIYVKGKLHVIVQDNIIVDMKIQISQFSVKQASKSVS